MSVNVYPERFHSRYVPVTESGCWVWTGGTTSTSRSRVGYGSFWAGYAINKGKQISAHRYSYYLATGHWPSTHEHILHKCDNGLCVNPDHLFLGTHQENMIDKANKGRVVSPNKLTKEQVCLARQMRTEGKQVKVIAERLGISASQMSRLVKGCQPKGKINCNTQ